MVILEPAGNLVKRIKQVYDKDREGWRILAGLDGGGRLDLYIAYKNKLLWKLKSKPVNPFSYLSVGAEVRDLNYEILEELLRTGRPFSFQALFPQNGVQSIVMLGLGRYLQERKTPISESEQRLDRILAEKVEELFSKMYPEKKTPYV
ncbi:hypothetical protein DRO58_06970 [Candidatus Bathyarchaeota archaeon]|nr:MAG: hypothetical protein DRO58_06970 [Candidatus Bathyarchaeota archaeon]